MTQLSTIHKQLLKGNSLTQRSALLDFGIMSLPRRIADLKEKGFPVKSEMKTNPLTRQRYASYSFDEGITHLGQLCYGHIYRVTSLASDHPFSEKALQDSQGYFQPLRYRYIDDFQIGIRMAGVPQLLTQKNLDRGTVQIKYIGEMH